MFCWNCRQKSNQNPEECNDENKGKQKRKNHLCHEVIHNTLKAKNFEFHRHQFVAAHHRVSRFLVQGNNNKKSRGSGTDCNKQHNKGKFCSPPNQRGEDHALFSLSDTTWDQFPSCGPWGQSSPSQGPAALSPCLSRSCHPVPRRFLAHPHQKSGSTQSQAQISLPRMDSFLNVKKRERRNWVQRKEKGSFCGDCFFFTYCHDCLAVWVAIPGLLNQLQRRFRHKGSHCSWGTTAWIEERFKNNVWWGSGQTTTTNLPRW